MYIWETASVLGVGASDSEEGEMSMDEFLAGLG
jgi:hypothetical protein